jgi:hypothetical protein
MAAACHLILAFGSMLSAIELSPDSFCMKHVLYVNKQTYSKGICFFPFVCNKLELG